MFCGHKSWLNLKAAFRDLCLLDFEFWRSFARVSASVNEAPPKQPNSSCLRRVPPGENHNTNHLAASRALPDVSPELLVPFHTFVFTNLFA